MAKEHPVIVVDIDGVLFNTPSDAVAAFNEEHATSYNVTDIFDHNAVHDKSKFYIEGVDHFHKHQHDTAAYNQADGAKEALQRLRQKGAKIIALTSRNYDSFYDTTVAAINEHFGVGDTDNDLIAEVYFTTEPANDQHREKGEIIKELGGDILVDDAVRYCESAVKHGIPAILLAQPYNESGHNWPPEKRASNWIEAEQLIELELSQAQSAKI